MFAHGSPLFAIVDRVHRMMRLAPLTFLCVHDRLVIVNLTLPNWKGTVGWSTDTETSWYIEIMIAAINRRELVHLAWQRQWLAHHRVRIKSWSPIVSHRHDLVNCNGVCVDLGQCSLRKRQYHLIQRPRSDGRQKFDQSVRHGPYRTCHRYCPTSISILSDWRWPCLIVFSKQKCLLEYNVDLNMIKGRFRFS